MQAVSLVVHLLGNNQRSDRYFLSDEEEEGLVWSRGELRATPRGRGAGLWGRGPRGDWTASCRSGPGLARSPRRWGAPCVYHL